MTSASADTIAHTTRAIKWTFRSKSSPRTRYETILYSNGDLSCNCPGWTQRKDKVTGERSCKHTRWAEEGDADRLCESREDHANNRLVERAVMLLRFGSEAADRVESNRAETQRQAAAMTAAARAARNSTRSAEEIALSRITSDNAKSSRPAAQPQRTINMQPPARRIDLADDEED
jgi:hypothetical protein